VQINSKKTGPGKFKATKREMDQMEATVSLVTLIGRNCVGAGEGEFRQLAESARHSLDAVITQLNNAAAAKA
jgi:hypothetical protein